LNSVTHKFINPFVETYLVMIDPESLSTIRKGIDSSVCFRIWVGGGKKNGAPYALNGS
jgi:hypothetical protein